LLTSAFTCCVLCISIFTYNSNVFVQLHSTTIGRDGLLTNPRQDHRRLART